MNQLGSSSASAQDIVERTARVVDAPADQVKFEEWRMVVRQADATSLIEATARLSSDPGKRARDLKALREAIISEVERKNSVAVVETPNTSVNATSNERYFERLGRYSWRTTHASTTSVLDPKSMLLTGLSRDGTFLIENGRIEDHGKPPRQCCSTPFGRM